MQVSENDNVSFVLQWCATGLIVCKTRYDALIFQAALVKIRIVKGGGHFIKIKRSKRKV